MKMIGQVALSISHRGRTIKAMAPFEERLTHKMIISWRDCHRLEVVPNKFPLPPTIRKVNDICTEAETIRETITNKYNIIRDNISNNKILMELAKVKFRH